MEMDIEGIVKQSPIYKGNKRGIYIEQTIKGIEQSYMLLKALENFSQYIPTLYELPMYVG